MRFLADRMLGRLAKWLRIMGQDCAYLRTGSIEEIAECALCENRVLLTRDTRLAKHRRVGINLLIESDHLDYQLVQVIDEFKIDPIGRAFSRCIVCNEPLQPTTVARVGHSVPTHVLRTQPNLASCPSCHRIYWGATHRERMKTRLLRLRLATETGHPRDTDPGEPVP